MGRHVYLVTCGASAYLIFGVFVPAIIGWRTAVDR